MGLLIEIWPFQCCQTRIAGWFGVCYLCMKIKHSLFSNSSEYKSFTKLFSNIFLLLWAPKLSNQLFIFFFKSFNWMISLTENVRSYAVLPKKQVKLHLFSVSTETTSGGSCYILFDLTIICILTFVCVKLNKFIWIKILTKYLQIRIIKLQEKKNGFDTIRNWRDKEICAISRIQSTSNCVSKTSGKVHLNIELSVTETCKKEKNVQAFNHKWYYHTNHI